jgi:uridine phosphorylase
MPFPNFPGKHDSEPVLKASDLLDFRQRKGKSIRLDAQNLILCFQPALVAHSAKRHGGVRVYGFFGEVYLLNKTKPRIALAGNFGIGAPGMAALLEEMAVMGIRRCISVGIAGALQNDLAPGNVIIPTEAIRDDGTSHHYLPPNEIVRPASALLASLTSSLEERGVPYRSAQVWTTDAPYRETAAEVEYYAQQGVLAVEMEAAALFAVSTCLGIEAASALVISDSLAGGVWKPAGDGRAVNQSLQALFDIAVEVFTT